MNRNFLNLWLLAVPDFLLMYAGLFVTILFRYNNSLSNFTWFEHFKVFSFLYLIWLLVFFIHGLFEVQSLRRYAGLIFNLLSAMSVNLIISVSYFYLQPNLILTPRRFLLLNLGISFLLILAWRLLVKYILKNRIVEPLYIFSYEDSLSDLEKEIKNHSYLGYRILGRLNEENILKTNINNQSGIILPESLNTKPEILNKLYTLRKLGVKFFNYQDFYERMLRKIYLTEINEAWFLENVDYSEKRFYKFSKRLLDLVLGLVGFVFFLLTFPILASLVKFSSRGPVFFIQERMGDKDKVFKVYKYRTMETGHVTSTWTSVNDSRITRIGRTLRKTRLDEIPQFINLLLGNMSLVGPRPEQPHFVEKLKKEIPFYEERHLVKPGLTGWAQLNIYASSVEESKIKLQYDLYYIKHRSFSFDLEIILKTIYYIFTWQGR